MKKILTKQLGITPYRLSNRTLTGRVMLGLMVIKDKTNDQKHFGPETFEIIIPTYFWKNYPLKGVEQEHLAFILKNEYDRFCELLFAFLDSRLILKAEGNVSHRLDILRSMVEFCDKYSICENELKLETLIKHYQRARKHAKSVATSHVRKKTMNMSIVKKH